MNRTTVSFCGHDLIKFSRFYATYIHGYASLLICVVGVIGNIVNIIVFNRKDMISPVNIVLKGLSIADFLVLVDYIPYSWHTCLRAVHSPPRELFSYSWALFILWHSYFSQVFHTIGIWLTIVLAVWRYVAVAHPLQTRFWCDMRLTKRTVTIGFIICPMLCVPLIITFNIIPVSKLVDEDGYVTANTSLGINTTLYIVGVDPENRSDFMLHFNFITYSIVFKVIPSIALTALSIKLVFALLQSKRHHQNLRAKALGAEKETNDRTTKILLSVLVLFLITEVPQGILGLLVVVYGERFLNDCYTKLGDVVDLLALVNSSLNFFLYYAMSRVHRLKVKSLLTCKSKITNITMTIVEYELEEPE